VKYNVEIREILSRTININASSSLSARNLAERSYWNEDIVLDSDDYVCTEFCVTSHAATREEKVLPYYKSPQNDFTLIKGDCVSTLSKFKFEFDMVFADPPYFLSGGGISYQSGKVVCVDKGEWDKPTTPEEMDAFNMRWLSACRDHMKDNATIWISGTHHNIFSVQQQLLKLGFKILNVITWAKTNPPPNISCRYFTYSTEFIIWARKLPKVAHYYNYGLMKQLNGDKQMTDVWQLPAIGRWEKSCGKHPTQKPLGLLARLIQASTEPGAWILDPFSGSATTGIAANLLGRRYLGLEIEDEFLLMSRARREEIERTAVRNEYLERLAKAKMVLPPDNFFVAEKAEIDYNVPWI
jgi:site-specific DNA-methyltransferase (adenine-specific)